MLISIMLNGKKVVDDISPDMTLFKFLRAHGCYSVKCGCETTNCGLCTVFLDEKPVLSWLQERMDIKWRQWKGFRKRQKSLEDLLPIREQNNVVSVIRA
mgnify:CR=1 FL=1